MELKAHSKYFLLALFVVLLIGSILIVRPFVSAALTALVLGYIFFPVYRWINKRIKMPNVSALIMTFLLLFIIIVPAFLFSTMLVQEATGFYQTFEPTSVTSFMETHFNLELGVSAQEKMADVVDQGINYLIAAASDFIFSLPMKIVNFIIMLFIFFFVFKDGEKIIKQVKDSFPIQDSHKTRVFSKIQNTIDSLVYGEIVISILEGAVAVLGFWLLGVPSPWLWGTIVAVVALLPAIGPLIVWVPIAVVFFLLGDVATAVGVALFGLIILTILLDMILKPKVLGYKGHIHPIIILLGVLGGIGLFGLTGIILGPIILVLLILLIDIYVKEGIK